MNRYLEAVDRALRRFELDRGAAPSNVIEFSVEEWRLLREGKPEHLEDLRRAKALFGGEVVEFRLAGRGRR